jgi:hypothetical protein
MLTSVVALTAHVTTSFNSSIQYSMSANSSNTVLLRHNTTRHSSIYSTIHVRKHQCLHIHYYCRLINVATISLVGVQAPPEPWFQDRETYEFHVSNRAPMKKDMTQAPEW